MKTKNRVVFAKLPRVDNLALTTSIYYKIMKVQPFIGKLLCPKLLALSGELQFFTWHI